MIQLFNISKAYQREQSALSDITLQVAKGEFVYLTGPSGAFSFAGSAPGPDPASRSRKADAGSRRRDGGITEAPREAGWSSTRAGRVGAKHPSRVAAARGAGTAHHHHGIFREQLETHVRLANHLARLDRITPATNLREEIQHVGTVLPEHGFDVAGLLVGSEAHAAGSAFRSRPRPRPC